MRFPAPKRLTLREPTAHWSSRERSRQSAGRHADLARGTAARTAGPAYPHQIINTSLAPLKYLSVSTRESPEICEYPDSGKFLAEAVEGTVTHFDVIHKSGDSVD
jgi:uncharacterized cupin superfamily protein